jgi:hypothetical protein
MRLSQKEAQSRGLLMFLLASIEGSTNSAWFFCAVGVLTQVLMVANGGWRYFSWVLVAGTVLFGLFGIHGTYEKRTVLEAIRALPCGDIDEEP